MWLQNESIYQAYVRPQLSPDVIKQIEGRLEWVAKVIGEQPDKTTH